MGLTTSGSIGAAVALSLDEAIGLVMRIAAAGKKVRVFAGETRPLFQGARLTAWELLQEGISHSIITDNSGGHLMQRGLVDFLG